MPTLDDSLLHFPWATFGRRESGAELARKCREQAARVALLREAPLVSLVVPFAGALARESHLTACLASLKAQSYGAWEAVVVAPRAYAFVERLVTDAGDARLRFVDAGEESSETELKNAGARHARGEWLGIVDPDAVLSPAALFFLVTAMQGRPEAALFYSHHAEVGADGKNLTALFPKPGPSWLDLVHLNYIDRFWLVRRDLFAALGGFATEVGGAHEHDFLLRVTETTRALEAVPAFLYYRREGGRRSSSARGSRWAVLSHLDRRGFPASVMSRDGRVKVIPEIPDPQAHPVTAIICFRDRAEITLRAAECFARQIGAVPAEILFVNNQSRKEEAGAVRARLGSFGCRARLVDYDAPFNFAEMHNVVARRYSDGKYLLLLNNDVFWNGSGTLDELVAWAAQPGVGTVGITLRYANGKLQHGGMRARFGGPGRLVRIAPEQDESFLTRETREVFANTFAACLFRRDVLEAVGGLRSLELADGFGDVAFGLECRRRGLRNLILGDIDAVHLESVSRGPVYEYWEERLIEREYPELVAEMVLSDLRVDRARAGELSLPAFAKARLRETAPWLAEIPPRARAWLKSLRIPGETT